MHYNLCDSLSGHFLSLRGYCFSSIGNLGNLAVSFSTLSETFNCSLVILSTKPYQVITFLVTFSLRTNTVFQLIDLCNDAILDLKLGLYTIQVCVPYYGTRYPLCTISKDSHQDRLSNIKVSVFTMGIMVTLLICLLFLNSLLYRVQSCAQ